MVAGLALVCAACIPADLNALANNDMAGRATGTPGGIKARNYVVDQLSAVTAGANTAGVGRERYLQRFGTNQANVVAVIPGTDLSGEYVAVGAHYDHLGTVCHSSNSSDHICNGATDNAAGVAAVLDLAHTLAARPARRSILITLWDSEERGIAGSKYYVAHPIVPLAKIITYVNADILGANLTPGLRGTTFAIGSETGGAPLRGAVDAANAATPLDVVPLSLILGEGRSDHAPFADAQVPVVFLSDSTGGCYHTAQDDINVVDQGKLVQEAETMTRLVTTLATTSSPPTFQAGTPVTTYDDAVAFSNRVVDPSWPDRARFNADDQATMAKVRSTVHTIVAAGATAFNGDSASAFLGAAADSSRIVAHLPCDGFLAP